MNNGTREPAVWFPAVRCGTGSDVFTETLVEQLQRRGIRAEITWLPLRAEYAPWTVSIPKTPPWTNVVHINTWLHPRFIPKELSVVATLHHSIHHPDLAPYKGRARSAYHRHWIARIERATLRRADRVAVVSHFAAASARAALLDQPMVVIWNGVDDEVFCPPDVRVPHRPFRLLYVGSWVARKGVDLLPAIMRELGDGFELRYTGGFAPDKHRADWPRNMCDIGRLAGTVAVVAAMQDADALLFPSRNEGFGLVAAEAMACGLPVIATRGSSLVEVIGDGITGLLCPRDDVGAFVSAVRELTKRPARALAFSRAGPAYVSEHFSVSKMVEAYTQLYKDLLFNNTRSAP